VRGVDDAKDQSYVLYMLRQRELARSLFPVGEITKAEVRAHATALGLRTADKPESMDVCFVKKGGRVAFLDQRTPMRAGDVVDASGAVLGTHPGVASFTIGQRRGVGVALGARRYVVDIDTSTARVTLGSRADLMRDRVHVRDLTFVDEEPDSGMLHAQVRAHGEPVVAFLDGNAVCFAQPQPRVAPGQVVALYHGEALVGGGIAA
jgi:tRNA-specific 2-thiouridylase